MKFKEIRPLPGNFPLQTVEASWQGYLNNVIRPSMDDIAVAVDENGNVENTIMYLNDTYYSGFMLALSAFAAVGLMPQKEGVEQMKTYEREVIAWVNSRRARYGLTEEGEKK